MIALHRALVRGFRLPLLVLALSLTTGVARAGVDSDVDDALAILKATDALTKDEAARYETALNTYADQKQKFLISLGALLEADEAEVDGKWDRICDGGLTSLAELIKAIPDKVKLLRFFESEAKTWDVLKKITLPKAEEDETRLLKMLETISPALDKSMQEMIEEDRRADDETAKTWARARETAKNFLRVVLNVAVDGKELGDAIDDTIKNPEPLRAAAQQVKEEAAKKIGRMKAFTARVQLAMELNKRVEQANEETVAEMGRAKDGLAGIQHSKAVVAHAQVWIKVVDTHFQRTRGVMAKYNELVQGKLVGNISNDTKDKLGDQDFYKEQIAQLEADTKAIDDGLNQFERRINEYREGDFKTKLKEILAKCRQTTKDVSDLRSTLKSEYESALNDAGLRK